MSIKHAMAVRDSGLLKGAAFMVAMALANRTNNDGVCWPGVALMAFDARLSERAVRKATKELRRRNLLSVDRGARKTNSYRLNLSLFEDAAKSRQRHLDVDPMPLIPRHLSTKGERHYRHNEPARRQLKAETPEPPSSNTKDPTSNLKRARRIEPDADETLAILELSWDWKAEEQFMLLAQTILGSPATESWFQHGRPRFVIFVDPVQSHGRRAEGLGISWVDEIAIPADIDKVMRALGFDEDAIWPWSKFLARLSSELLPALRPTKPTRLRFGSNA